MKEGGKRKKKKRVGVPKKGDGVGKKWRRGRRSSRRSERKEK